jgi:hypothetical protein
MVTQMHRILGTGVPSWDSSEGEPLDYKQVRGHFQTFWWVGIMMVVYCTTMPLTAFTNPGRNDVLLIH